MREHDALGRIVSSRTSCADFDPSEIPDAEIVGLFELARWAQSSWNEQPWRFLLAPRDDRALRPRLEALLDEGNRYAAGAWILGVVFAHRNFTSTGRPNRHHMFDVGAACQILALAAHAKGLAMRFMAGFDMDRALALAPPAFEPAAMMALGRPSANECANRRPKPRRHTDDFLFMGAARLDPWLRTGRE